jgi:hypothetical protein
MSRVGAVAVVIASFGIALSACGNPTVPVLVASNADYAACTQLRIINHEFDTANTTGKPLAQQAFVPVVDAALSATNARIQAIGEAMKVDIPTAFNGGDQHAATNDFVKLLAACKSLNWNGRPDPAIHP